MKTGLQSGPQRAHRIVFLDRSTVDASFRAPSFPHTWIEHAQTHEDEVYERLQDATIAITNKVPLHADLLGRLEKLELIAVAATGVDIIDLAVCKLRKIAVSNVRAYATGAVPEHAMMLALALRRNLLAYREDVISGRWSRADTFCLLGREIGDLGGSTFGVIGYGPIGRATAKLAEAFGMRVLVAEHKDAREIRPDRTPFPDVLRQSDVISLHAPLLPATRNLISTAELRSMKQSAILINTARGGLVDEAALRTALVAGWIGGAGFDVLEREPPKDGTPLLELAERPDVIITPHVAWASRRAMQSLADQLIDNLEAFARGAPRNLVV
jgi:glycerate dehydrogenase